MTIQERFKQFLTERLTVAASEIFGVFEQLIVDYQMEMDQSTERTRLQLLATLHRTGDQQFSSPNPSETKEEQELWATQEENISTSQLSLHHYAPTVENNDALPTNTADHVKVEPDDDGVPEPASDSQPPSAIPPDCPTTLRLAKGRGEPPSQTETGTSMTTFLEPRTSLTTFPMEELISPSQVSSINGNIQATSSNLTGRQTIHQDGANCFSSEHALQNHMQTHVEDQLYHCQECGKGFTQKYALLVHMKTHTEARPHQCLDCGKSFTQNIYLNKHRRTHTKEKPYQCQECGRYFSKKYNLITHMKTHTGERAHHCQACGKSFIQKRDLINHARLHTGETPYQCQECGQAFSYQSALISHVKKHIRARNKIQKLNLLLGCGDI